MRRISISLSWIDKSIDFLLTDPSYLNLMDAEEFEEIDGNIYIQNSSSGVSFVFNKEKLVTSIHLYPSYTGEVPIGLTFGMSSEEIESRFGTPSNKGGGYIDLIFGFVPKWSKWRLDNYAIHCQFSDQEQSVDLITFSSLKIEPCLLQNSN